MCRRTSTLIQNMKRIVFWLDYMLSIVPLLMFMPACGYLIAKASISGYFLIVLYSISAIVLTKRFIKFANFYYNVAFPKMQLGEKES